MMSDKIRMDTERMEDLVGELKRLSSMLDRIGSEVRGIHINHNSGADVYVRMSSLRFDSVNGSLSGDDAQECLRTIANYAARIEDYTNELSRRIRFAAEMIADEERERTRRFENLETADSIYDGLCRGLGYSTDRNTWTPQMKASFANLISGVKVLVDGSFTYLVSETAGYLFDRKGLLASYKQEDGANGTKQTARLFSGNSEDTLGSRYANIGISGSKDILGQKRIAGDPNNAEAFKRMMGDTLSILGFGAQTGVSVSALADGDEYRNGGFKAGGNWGVGNAEAHAGAKGGLGVFLPDGDGNNELCFGVGADAGASASAAKAKGSLAYELCDNVELGLEGELELLEAEAELGVGAGIVDGKPTLYAGAGAEANLAEVTADTYVDVAGIKGVIGVGAQYGIGAHAKVGFKDGKLAYDVGAAMGGGASVYGSVDISGMLENASKELGGYVERIAGVCAWI